MATIQRTFKDPALQNPLKYLGYDSIPVEIEDGGTSENYFNVQGIGSELHAGKNIFYIKPDSETLIDNAEIGVEVLDANGDLVPVRLLDNRKSDGSIGLVIEVDETRPKGYGQITLVSVARGQVIGARLQPLRNTDNFNIRWAKRVYLNRDGLNTSEITYISPPSIEVAELKLPYYISHFNTELTASLSSALTSANPTIVNEITCSIYQLSSSFNTAAKISYEKQREQIYLELTGSDFGGFVSDMENGTLFFDASNIAGIEPSAATLNTRVEDGDGFDDIASEGSYFTSILQVLSPTRMLVSSPHTTFQGSGQNLHEVMHQTFQPSNFTLTWAMPPYSHSRYPDNEGDDTKYLTSYAGIQVSNLDPYSGDVHRIKTYVRAESRPDDYVMCSDLVVESQELLIVSESEHYNKIRFKNIPCGKFDRLNSSPESSDVGYFANYWTSSAVGLDAPSLTIVSRSYSTDDHTDFVPMRPSLRVGTLGEVSPLDDNVGRDTSQPMKTVELKSTVSASFKQDKVYVLEVSGYVKGRDLLTTSGKNSGVVHGIGSFTVGLGSKQPFKVNSDKPQYPWSYLQGGVIAGKGVTNPFTVAEGPNLSAPRIDIFGFGEAFQDDTNRLGQGKLIGEINDAPQPQGSIVDVKKIEGYGGVDHVLEVNLRFPFKADANAVGEFRFEIERGLWYFQEISVKPYHRDGVTPHQYDYLVPLPRGLSHPERRDVFDFMFEFYNIEGHMCAEKVYIDNICMDNEYTLAPTTVITDIIDNDGGDVTINGPLTITNLTNITSSITYDTSSLNITQTFGDILMYNSSSGEVGHVELGCGLGFMDKDNCCCHLHGDTNVYIFIDDTSLNITGTATETPNVLTRYLIPKFEKDMRERYPYWKGNIYVGTGHHGQTRERWLSWMSWPAVGNQQIDNSGIGQGITGSMESVKWQANAAETSELNGTYLGSDDFEAYGYRTSEYYLENAPIIKDGRPDNNVIVFAIVDETNTAYHGNTALLGTSTDFSEQLTDDYKRDYGLFVGKSYPQYNCFTGYVYALPSSNNITHGARQEFALHVYAAIETGIVSSTEFIGTTATLANLSAITGSNPYANAINTVGTLSPHYQGGVYGLKSQSISEKHNFTGGVAGWYDNLSYPVASATINKSSSWAQGQATFSGDLFNFIDGNSIGVKVDATTICINESNELYATNTGSFTGSFTGEITGDTILNIDRSITINGGINTYIVGDTFIVGGNSITIFNGDVTHITNLTASHQHITQITESLNINNTYGDVLMYNSQSEEIGAIALGCGLGFMDKDNCCCHLHGDTNIYIFIDNTSMNIVNSNPNGGGASRYTPQLITKWVITKFEKDMRERYPYWKGNVYVGQGTSGPGSGTLPAERWLSWMSWPAVGNQRIDGSGIGQGITGSMSSVTWGEYPIGTTTNDESNGDYVGSDNFAAHGYSSSAYYLENSPIIRDGKPDSNVIVFAMVDETDPGTVAGPGKGYHYRDTLNGVAADFDNHLTDEYKMDYGLFIGKAYPAYDCFSGYVYALPSSNNITHAARQNFALHVYAAINDRVTSAEFIGATPTTGNLSAITGSNPYGHGSASVGTLSPWYQGAMFGLHSQSIGEKHDFAGGVAGWHDPFTYPVSVTNINRSGSWLHGQASFSADLFEFVDGDSIGVRVDAKTICINESNELYATNTGSFTGSFTGEITGDTILNIDRSITINGGINTYIVGDTFIIGGDNITVINTDVSYITNLTASNAFFHSMTASSATGNFSGSFTGSFDGDARLTGSFTGSFAGNLIGTASYGVDNDWYLQGGTADPTIDGDIYHTGKVGVGDFSSANITHTLTVLGDISASGTIYGKEFHTQYVSSSIIYMSGSTKFGDTADDRADFTGSIQLSHSAMSVFTGSGKFAFGVQGPGVATFNNDSTRIAQFYSGSSTGVTLNVTNWETASAFTEAGGITGDSSPAERGPRATISVNALNSSASYGYGGTRGAAGGSISYHPDTFEGNTNQDDIGDGGDIDSLGRRLLQEVLHITTGGNPQGSINIQARGNRGQQLRFFTGGDDARNTGGKSIETQRMTIIHEGLVGIGTHNPQRRLHISESGHNYAASKGLVPLRVNDFYEGTGQHALIWDENTGDVYRKSLEELTATGGDSGVGTLSVGDTFIIGPFNTFINDAHFFGNITASGNISASDPNGIHIFGGSSTFHHITASGNISASDPNGIHTLGGDVTLGVDCTDDLNIKATVTASCNVSISADLYFDRAYGARAIFHDNDANTGIEFASDTITIKENGQQSAVFATTGGNSIGNASYRTSITGSTITLGDDSDQHTTASADLWLKTDYSTIHFGADKDIILSHQPDSGLKLSNKFTSLGAGSANSQSSLLGLTLHNDTTTVADNDFIGGIFYTSDTVTEEEGGNSDKTFASIVGQVQTTAAGREAGALYVNVMNAGESSSAVTIKGNQNVITNHFGTKHEQLTTLSSSNHFPLILSSLKNFSHQHYLVWDEATGYVSAKSLKESGGTNTDNGIGNAIVGITLIVSTAPVMTNGGTYIIGGGGTLNLTTINEFAIGPIVYLTQNTVINQNLNVLGSLIGDTTIGSNCDDYLLIKSKVTASCIISSSQDVVLKAITGSGTISMSGTGHNWFGGAINVTSIARDAQSNIPATIMGDDVSIIDGSLIVGERASQNGIPNNAIVGGAESLIVGQGNAVTNQNARSIVMGYYNSGSGLANFVGGSAGNKGLSDVTMVFGYGNHNEDNDGGIVLGSYNHISATSTNGHHAIGTRLVNSGSKGGSIVLGMNNTHGVTDAIFTIGDGHAYNQRRDLLVARSGSIEILGHVTQSGNISISGILEASQKSFVIPHPTKQGKKLVYGVLEGPEHAVYVRGKVDTNCIDLPEEWIGLVDEDSITVQLTPIGKHQNLYVEEIGNTKILIKNSNLLTKSINAFYFVQGTRKDIQPLQTERDA